MSDAYREREVLEGIALTMAERGVGMEDDEFVVDVHSTAAGESALVSRIRRPCEGVGGAMAETPIDDGFRWTCEGVRNVAVPRKTAIVDSLVRASLRERATGTRDGPWPLWSYDAPRAMLAMLDHHGVPRERLADTVRLGYADHDGLQHDVEKEVFTLPDGTLAIVQARSSTGRMVLDLDRTATPGGVDVGMTQDADGVEILLHGVSLPATLDHAHAGRRLGDLVDHPAFDAIADMIVVSAGDDDAGIGFAIRLPLEPVPLAPPPPGVDVSWMAIDPGFGG